MELVRFDDYGNPIGPICVYCSKCCFVKSSSPRLDGASYIATCGPGKMFDRMSEEVAEAFVKVQRKGWDNPPPYLGGRP